VNEVDDRSASEGTCLEKNMLVPGRVLGILGRRIFAKAQFSCLYGRS